MAEEQTLDTNPDDVAITDAGGTDDKATGDKGQAPNAAETTDKPVVAKAEAGKGDGKPAAPGAGDSNEDKPAEKGDAKADVAPAWPEDWREKAAGGDAKKLARLAKYASPQAVADALIDVQNKLSSTRAIPPLKKDATPEQIKEYREAMGIPESADKYDLAGYTIAEKDKPLIEQYLAKAHATNQTPEQVLAGIDAYYEITNRMAEERHSNDANYTKVSEDALRAEWGNDFRRNVNLINSFLDNAPQGLKERILTGRLSDGTPIGSDPDALRWLLGLELERNPVGVVTPGAGANMKQNVDDELKKISDFRASNRTAYNKDEKMQARERQLLEYKLLEEAKSKKAA